MTKFSKHCRVSLQACGVALVLGMVGCGGPEANLPQAGSSVQEAALVDAGDCSFDGTWAMKFVVPVKWTGNIGVQPGSGEIVQYLKSTRHRDGSDMVDTLQVCASAVPDYHSVAMFGNELYGIRFPNALFDAGTLPSTDARTHMSGFTVGSTFTSDQVAFQIGLDMQNATSAEWPRKWSQLQGTLDSDGDGKPGVTVVTDKSAGYSNPPVGLNRWGKRAEAFYTAVRNVASIAGTVNSCDQLSGTAEIPAIAGKTAINAHVLGCRKTDGTSCTAGEINLIDSMQPEYLLAGTPQFTLQRVADGATCVDIRAIQF